MPPSSGSANQEGINFPVLLLHYFGLLSIKHLSSKIVCWASCRVSSPSCLEGCMPPPIFHLMHLHSKRFSWTPGFSWIIWMLLPRAMISREPRAFRTSIRSSKNWNPTPKYWLLLKIQAKTAVSRYQNQKARSILSPVGRRWYKSSQLQELTLCK